MKVSGLLIEIGDKVGFMTEAGRGLDIVGLTHDQVRELAPLFMQQVTITVEAKQVSA